MYTARLLKPFSICMTGISGSGKTTIAKAVIHELEKSGLHIELLDGDETRKLVGELFGHSRQERQKMSIVNQTIGYYLLRNNVSFILSVVAPFEEMRTQFRNFFAESYIEVYVKASVETCIARDVKGLYKLSSEKKVDNLNGINADFEVPKNSHLTIDTEKETIQTAAGKIVDYLGANKFVQI